MSVFGYNLFAWLQKGIEIFNKCREKLDKRVVETIVKFSQSHFNFLVRNLHGLGHSFGSARRQQFAEMRAQLAHLLKIYRTLVHISGNVLFF